MLRVELRGEARDGGGFGVAGGNVGVEIGIAIKHVAEAGEIVVEIHEVAGDKSCVAVLRGRALENVDHAGEVDDVGLGCRDAIPRRS